MIMSYRCARFFSNKINVVNKCIASYYFSADSDHFLKRIKTLENLKTSDKFSEILYEDGKYILFFKNDMVCLKGNDKLLYKDYKDIRDLKNYGDPKTVLLDVLTISNSEVCLFAMDLEVENDTDMEKIECEVDGKFMNVRTSMYFLDQKESQYVTHARGLINFCKTYNFCCYCGGNLKVKEGGHQKQCQNCKHTHYPNLSPIGLTLIDNEKHEEVLLVRQKRHPPGMYTCVAGFIEPGESVEETVKREVAEELGLIVHNVQYCTSQHWALPSCQLVLGCFATSDCKKTDIDAKEILDAKWVTAEDLKDAVMRVQEMKDLSEMNEKKLWAPPRNAVSYYLMVAWLRRYHNFEPTSPS